MWPLIQTVMWKVDLTSSRFTVNYPPVTFPAEERLCPSTSTKLYCLVTEVHRCEQLAQGCYAALSRCEIEPTTY